MQTSESIKELAGAMAKAQAIMAGAAKDKTNPAFRSKYADLASVWEACREALTKHGLSVVQATATSERQEVVVVTRLMHLSGEWMESTLALPVIKNDAQGFGSALTYARRYALAAMVGVAPEEDDGNAATAARPTPLTRPIPANVEGQDAWSKLDADTKDMLETTAATATRLVNEGKDAAGYLESLGFDDDTKLALWTRLDAPTRTAIKKARKPALAEQA